MAKSKKPVPQPKKKAVKKRSRGSKQRSLDPKALAYARLLADPCNAEVPDGVYPGEKGWVQRFRTNASINAGAANTCGFFIYIPSSNQLWLANNLTSATANTAAWTLVNSPGHPYLNTNAGKARPLAACIQLVPSATSVTTLTGQVCSTVTSADRVWSSAALSVDNIFTSTNVYKLMTKETLEFKWFPNIMDNRYFSYANNTAGTGPDLSDCNALIVAYKGYPAGIALDFSITVVYEFTPTLGIGITPTTATSSGIKHEAVVKALHDHHPDWWHQGVDSLKRAAMGFGNTLLKAGVNKGLQYFESFAPTIPLLFMG